MGEGLKRARAAARVTQPNRTTEIAALHAEVQRLIAAQEALQREVNKLRALYDATAELLRLGYPASALRELLTIQGETVPVLNDEYIRASVVREIATKALARLTAAPEAQPDGEKP
jgi:hypothetical protein